MTKILFSKTISINDGNNNNVEIFYEKYWEPGFVKPLYRYGECFHSMSGMQHEIIKGTHLLSRPNLKQYIKRNYGVDKIQSI